MIDPLEIAEAPPKSIRFKRRSWVWSNATSSWRNRGVVRALVERDFRARYKQAVLGVAWSVLQPLIMALVFAFVIVKVAHPNTHGVPYFLFAYLGLVPWGFVSGALTIGSTCLVSNQALLNKVNCPREVFPTGAVILAGIDGLIASIGLLIAYFGYGYTPSLKALLVIPIFGLELMFTWGVTMILSILLVYLRDMRQVVPIILQIGLFATPTAYSMSFFPKRILSVYSVANPLGPMIESYRRLLFYGQYPQWHYLFLAGLTTLVVVVAGAVIFKRFEYGIADIL